MDPLVFRIPVSSHVVKKNNRPIFGRGEKKWIGKGPKLRNAEAYLTSVLKSYVSKYDLKPLSGDIHAIFRFYFDNFYTSKKKRSRSLPDLSNLYELPQDCLQAAGVIENDSDIVSHDGSGRFPGSENILEIELRVLKEGIYGRTNPRCVDCPCAMGV